jgi:hypothetical protein
MNIIFWIPNIAAKCVIRRQNDVINTSVLPRQDLALLLYNTTVMRGFAVETLVCHITASPSGSELCHMTITR